MNHRNAIFSIHIEQANGGLDFRFAGGLTVRMHVSNRMTNFVDSVLSTIQRIEIFLAAVEGYRWRIDWLLDFNKDFPSILNLGCDKGYETIALMWFLNSKNALGIDKDPNHIDQANSSVRYFIDDLNNLRRSLNYSSELPRNIFLKSTSLLKNMHNRTFPDFSVNDLTAKASMPGDDYDLAYCERVLYHIASGENNEPKNNLLRSAIVKVRRALKRGGIFIAIEPKTSSPDSEEKLDLSDYFHIPEFIRCEDMASKFVIENKEIYCYTKN